MRLVGPRLTNPILDHNKLSSQIIYYSRVLSICQRDYPAVKAEPEDDQGAREKDESSHHVASREPDAREEFKISFTINFLSHTSATTANDVTGRSFVE